MGLLEDLNVLVDPMQLFHDLLLSLSDPVQQLPVGFDGRSDHCRRPYKSNQVTNQYNSESDNPDYAHCAHVTLCNISSR